MTQKYSFIQGPPHVLCHVGVYIGDLAIKSGVGDSQADSEQLTSVIKRSLCVLFLLLYSKNEPILPEYGLKTGQSIYIP